jgi:hypothetical protein
MNGVLLIIAALALLVLPKLLLNKVKHPYNSYIKFISALLLLLLVWLSNISGDNNRIPFKVIITTVVLYELYRNFINFRKLNSESVKEG